MYNRTNWVNEVWDPQDRVTLTDMNDGTYKIAKAGTRMSTGTPQDRDHFNNLEHGVSDVSMATVFMARAIQQVQEDLNKFTAMEKHTVNLTNTARYPFNSSGTTVALSASRSNLDYEVEVELVSSSGIVGGIKIYDRQLNGFKVAFFGSATSATVLLRISGGV